MIFTNGGEFALENEVLHNGAEDEEQHSVFWGGSRPRKAPNLERHQVMYPHLLFYDFWGPAAVYNAMYFKKLFKLPIAGLFDAIVNTIVEVDDHFVQKRDASQKLGVSTLQKICSSVCLPTPGVSPNEHDNKY